MGQATFATNVLQQATAQTPRVWLSPAFRFRLSPEPMDLVLLTRTGEYSNLMSDDEYKDRKIVHAEAVAPVPEELPEGPRAVFELWMALRNSKTGAHSSKFHLDDLPVRIIPASMLYDVIDGGRDYRYRFFGSDRVNSHGEDYTNRHVSDITPPLMAEKIAAENAKVVEGKAPLVVNTIAALGDEEFQYSMIRLPLFDDAGDVVRIYSLPFNGTGPELPDRQWGHWFRRHSKGVKP